MSEGVDGSVITEAHHRGALDRPAELTGSARAGLGVTVVACAALALIATIIASSAGRAERVRGMHGQTIELTSAEAQGRELFAQYCFTCHTLHAVNAVAPVGPNLDFLRPPSWVVRRRIREGSQAAAATMPADIVTGSDATDVAAFVAKVAGR